MAVTYCGRKLPQSLGKAAPAYLKKKKKKLGASHYPGEYKHGLQYDWRRMIGALRCGLGIGI